MKKKTLTAISITSCLSFGAIAVFSGCGDARITALVNDVVDFNNDAIHDFLKSLKDKDSSSSVTGNSSGDSLDGRGPVSVNNDVIADGSASGGHFETIYYTEVPVESIYEIEYVSVTQPVAANPISDGMDKNNSSVLQNNDISSQDDDISFQDDDISSQDDEDENNFEPETDFGEMTPDPEVIDPNEVTYDPEPICYNFIKYEYDNSKIFSFTNHDGIKFCDVIIHGSLDVYYGDDYVYSVDTVIPAGSVEIYNFITGQSQIFAPGEIDDYEKYVHDMFDDKLYISGKVGPITETPVSIFDSTNYLPLYDADGNLIFEIIRYGVLEVYEFGELVSIIGEDKKGRLEVRNLITGEVFDYTGEYEQYGIDGLEIVPRDAAFIYENRIIHGMYDGEIYADPDCEFIWDGGSVGASSRETPDYSI